MLAHGLIALALLLPQTGIVGDPARGRELFRGEGHCGECHRMEQFGALSRGPSLDAHWRTEGRSLRERLPDRVEARSRQLGRPVVAVDYLLESLLDPEAHDIEGFASSMPPAAGPLLGLDEQQIADLVAYLIGEEPTPVPIQALPDPGPNPWDGIDGDPARGEEIYFRPDDLACAGCHLLRRERFRDRLFAPFWEEGGAAGPDLDGIALIQTPDQVLDSILRPNHRLVSGFEEVSIEDAWEGQWSGMLLATAPDGSLLMLEAGPAKTEPVLFEPGEIAEMELVPRSRMTPVFGGLLSPQERDDLLAFFRDLAREEPQPEPGRTLAPYHALWSGRWDAALMPKVRQRFVGIPVDEGSLKSCCTPDKPSACCKPKQEP